MKVSFVRPWKTLAVFGLVAIFGLPAGLFPAGSAVPAQELRSGADTKGEGAVIMFSSAFKSKPVVVVSGQWQGMPWLGAPDAISPSSFTFRFYNPSSKAPVTDPARTFMQYIAVVPDAGSKSVAADSVAAKDGDVIKIKNSLSGVPVIICSALSPTGVPLYSCPSAITAGSFTINLADLATGSASAGQVQYIALVPSKTLVSFGGARLAGGTISVAPPGKGPIAYGTTLPSGLELILCSSFLDSAKPTIATGWGGSSTDYQGEVYDFAGGPNHELSGVAAVCWVGIAQ